jgi:hypothetical protein
MVIYDKLERMREPKTEPELSENLSLSENFPGTENKVKTSVK